MKDIEKALGDCFDFIRDYIPLDEIYLHSPVEAARGWNA